MDGLLVKGVNVGKDIIVWSSKEAYGLEGKHNLCLIKPGHPGQEKRPLVRKGVRT